MFRDIYFISIEAREYNGNFVGYSCRIVEKPFFKSKIDFLAKEINKMVKEREFEDKSVRIIALNKI